jgi:hypothetical protein
LAKAYGLASLGLTVAIGMVVPGLLGVWLDRTLGTKVLFTVLGFAVGMTWGVIQLSRLARPKDGP